MLKGWDFFSATKNYIRYRTLFRIIYLYQLLSLIVTIRVCICSSFFCVSTANAICFHIIYHPSTLSHSINFINFLLLTKLFFLHTCEKFFLYHKLTHHMFFFHFSPFTSQLDLLCIAVTKLTVKSKQINIEMTLLALSLAMSRWEL